jgi:hypothetical protein
MRRCESPRTDRQNAMNDVESEIRNSGCPARRWNAGMGSGAGVDLSDMMGKAFGKSNSSGAS